MVYKWLVHCHANGGNTAVQKLSKQGGGGVWFYKTDTLKSLLMPGAKMQTKKMGTKEYSVITSM